MPLTASLTLLSVKSTEQFATPLLLRQAAEEKRIKDEAVRLAGVAASLARETERLERQRAQAEKLERDMRERFGAVSADTSSCHASTLRVFGFCVRRELFSSF